MGQWISERCMYVTPIRLDPLLFNTNQISFCKGKWYVRRFDPDTVATVHIYSSVKAGNRGGSVHILGLPRHFLCVRLRILWAGLIVISN